MKFTYGRLSAPLLVAALTLISPGGATNAPASAQPAAPEISAAQQCPTVTVSCPDTAKENLEGALTFTANVSGGDPNVTPTFNWTVSAGTISSGQGTSSISVDTTGIGGQTVTATVDVGGFSRECRTSNSCTTSIEKKSAPPVKFGEYATRDLSANKAQLDKFVLALQQDPTAQGYVIAYGGSGRRSATGQQRAQRARDYLVTTRGIDASRIVTLDGGQRTAGSLQLWLVPAGATPPRP